MAPWMTPGTGAEAVPGLTDFGARSGGEGEVGASVIGTYWFAQGVDEMTAHPRPASPEPTTVVETDHPLWNLKIHLKIIIYLHFYLINKLQDYLNQFYLLLLHQQNY